MTKINLNVNLLLNSFSIIKVKNIDVNLVQKAIDIGCKVTQGRYRRKATEEIDRFGVSSNFEIEK